MQYVTIPHAVMRADGMPANAVQVLASEGPMSGVDAVDRMGDIVAAGGLRLSEVGARGVPVLAQHDAASPIARATRVWRSGDRILAHVEFPPPGTSAKSDEYLGLVKTGIIDAVSIGFLPHRWEPIKGGGQRFTDWSLLEISFVSIAALPSARVTAKADSCVDDFTRRAAARVNELMVESGCAPTTSPSGDRLSDAERRHWTATRRQRQQTREVLDDPRYLHLRTAPYEERLAALRRR